VTYERRQATYWMREQRQWTVS